MQKLLCCIVFVLSPLVGAESKIYTWTDETGVIQFGDRPPLTVQASELKMNGIVTDPVLVIPALFQGNWNVVGQDGQSQEWLVREDGRIQIDMKLGNNRRIIHGTWTLSDSVMILTSDLIQDIQDGKSTINNAPVQFIYKFLGFKADQFRVFSNGGNYLGTKLTQP